MRRLLLAVAVAGTAFAVAPAAHACDLQHCPGTSTVCAVVGCPTPLHRCWSTDLVVVCIP